MAFFNKQFIDQLYIAETSAADKGFIAFVIPKGITPGVDTIELKEALASTTYLGSFVFAALPPVIDSIDSAMKFVTSIYNVLNSSGAGRAFVWLQDNVNINMNTAPVMGIDSNGTSVNSGLQAPLTTTLSLNITNGMALSWKDDSTLLLDGSQNNYTIFFSGPSTPNIKAPVIGTIPFSGPLRGTVQFSLSIQRLSLYNELQWGFQFLFPVQTVNRNALSEWLPLAGGDPGATDFIGFTASIDPTDVFNTAFDPCQTGNCTISGSYLSRRTWFNFTGINSDQTNTVLASYFRTVFGAAINLLPDVSGTNTLPARLVFAGGEYTSSTIQRFLLTPEGDFTMQMPSVIDGSKQYLIGGMQGTEFFSITPKTATTNGDKIRFISCQPAFAPKFPFQEASPVKQPPEDPNAPLLNNNFNTAWATLLAGEGNVISYIAQPKGSALFGSDALITPHYTDLFGHNIPGFTFIADDKVSFPMVPYNGITAGDGINSFSKEQIIAFENQVVSPARRKYVGALSTSRSLIKGNIRMAETVAPQVSTTPSGLLATITTSGAQMQWNEVLLGQNTDSGTAYSLKFMNPDEQLIEALQTGDLMLVAANANHLGALNGTVPGAPAFSNKVGIGSWEMTANVGQQNKYNDYRNVMIIKAKKGKLYDADDATKSLVANPSKWTQKDVFAAPTIIGPDGKLLPPDNDELVILSQWLQTYFKQAADKSGNKYFDKFNTIVKDENWTGILFLRMDISKLPENLVGIMAGVTDPDAFNAHHFAVEISPVKKDGANAALNQPSSMFGLIYYEDPLFDDTLQESVMPASSATYDFRLLTLKVLFENTAVSSFESLAQLTITELFKMPVSIMGDTSNVYYNVMLKGSLQITDNQTLYSLSSQGDNTFYFDNNIIHKIQISNVLLSTRNADKVGDISSWFGMSGFIDYYVIGDPVTCPVFDIFSFGNNEGEDFPNKGLRFNNLGISMIFPASAPSQKQMVMDVTQISFNTAHSTPRTNSLFLNFALDMQELVSADAGTQLSDKGYLPVIPDVALSDMSIDNWYGLKLKLNMGTPGELAGKLSLNSFLLLVWSPQSTGVNTYRGGIGISLPGTGGGAKLISLQNIMKLSIGQIRLAYSASQSSFLLMFTEIALQFLGLLKIPPNGSTLFYLFGNPDAGGKASGLGWYAMYRKKNASGLQAQQQLTTTSTSR